MASVAGALTVLWEIDPKPRITQGNEQQPVSFMNQVPWRSVPGIQGSFEQPTGTGFSQGSEKTGNLLLSTPTERHSVSHPGFSGTGDDRDHLSHSASL